MVWFYEKPSSENDDGNEDSKFKQSHKNMFDSMKSFSEDTTIHGIKEIFMDDNKILKLAWLILLITCYCGNIFCLVNIFLQYKASPTSTAVQHILPRYFPTILLCPQEWQQPTNFQGYNLTKIEIEEVLRLTRTMAYFNFKELATDQNEIIINMDLKRAAKNLAYLRGEMNVSSIYEFYKSSAYQITTNDSADQEKIYISSRYDDPMKKPTKFVTTDGVCYQIHFDPGNVTEDPASWEWINYITQNMLIYALPKGLPANYSIPDKINQKNLHRILLGPHAETKRSLNYYLIERGESYSFKLSIANHSFTQRSQCMENSEAEIMNCLVDCLDTSIQKLCNCSFFLGQTTDPTTPYCLLVNDPPDWTSARECYKNYSKIAQQTEQNCFVKCSRSCTQTIYTPTIINTGSGPFAPSDDSGLLLFEFQNYFASTSVQESETYTWQNALGNIGGMISLWSGCSFVSLAHIIYHFVCRRLCPRPQTVMQVSSAVVNTIKDLDVTSLPRISRSDSALHKMETRRKLNTFIVPPEGLAGHPTLGALASVQPGTLLLMINEHGIASDIDLNVPKHSEHNRVMHSSHDTSPGDPNDPTT